MIMMMIDRQTSPRSLNFASVDIERDSGEAKAPPPLLPPDLRKITMQVDGDPIALT